jgi:hypothetical protein
MTEVYTSPEESEEMWVYLLPESYLVESNIVKSGVWEVLKDE